MIIFLDDMEIHRIHLFLRNQFSEIKFGRIKNIIIKVVKIKEMVQSFQTKKYQKNNDDKPKELKSVVRLRKKGTPQQSKCILSKNKK